MVITSLDVTQAKWMTKQSRPFYYYFLVSWLRVDQTRIDLLTLGNSWKIKHSLSKISRQSVKIHLVNDELLRYNLVVVSLSWLNYIMVSTYHQSLQFQIHQNQFLQSSYLIHHQLIGHLILEEFLLNMMLEYIHYLK